MPLQETDLFAVGRGAATYKVTLKEMQEAMPAGHIDGGFANSNYGSAPPAIDGGAAS